jgi:hypothetical protein
VTECYGPAWLDHVIEETTYDLAHLNPFQFEVLVDAVDGKPGRPGREGFAMTMLIHFSHHCFTTAANPLEPHHRGLAYTDTRRGETRWFCAERWRLSKELPAIIRGLKDRRCYLTGRDNFFTVEAKAARVDYCIYFNIRLLRKGRCMVFVESAYERVDAPHRQHSARKISLNAILRNIRAGRRPQRPP